MGRAFSQTESSASRLSPGARETRCPPQLDSERRITQLSVPAIAASSARSTVPAGGQTSGSNFMESNRGFPEHSHSAGRQVVCQFRRGEEDLKSRVVRGDLDPVSQLLRLTSIVRDVSFELEHQQELASSHIIRFHENAAVPVARARHRKGRSLSRSLDRFLSQPESSASRLSPGARETRCPPHSSIRSDG